MSRVLVVDSTYDTCREAVDRAFATFPIDIRGKRVALKMNALKVGDPDRDAYVTNYKLVKAVIEKLETLHPAQILAGDSVGTEFYGDSEYVFEQTRLKEVADPYYRNFNKNLAVVQLKIPFERKVAVLRDVLEADVYISMPKMKTHGLAMISGSVKNNFGLLAGAQKAWYHYYSVKPETFAQILIEMLRLRPPDLVIMDAILAMEGYGPSSPETRWVNKVLVATDAVALDTVMAKIVGFSVDEVPYLHLAKQFALGETDLGVIEISGEAKTIEAYHRPTPSQSSFRYKAGVGGGTTSLEFFRQRVAYRPAIYPQNCRHSQGCDLCIDACPSGALSKGEQIPILESSQCMLCSACKEVCEASGLELLADEEIIKQLARMDSKI
jgi:uncharacterized protein (DUF362 family)/ferredoxin